MAISTKLPRKKKCAVCKLTFQPERSIQPCCSIKCAIAKVQIDKKAKFDKETKLKKEAIKSRAQWLREAQKEFNAYIRLRDADKPCISCDKQDNGRHQRHASHYRSVGACTSLRFNEANVHASCSTCNNMLSGNLIEYRIRLIKKIGLDMVDWIECQPKERRWTIDEIKEIKSIYKEKKKSIIAFKC